MEAFTPSLTAFYIISGVTLGLALLAVTTPNLVRAALALAFSFFALAGIFWLLGSPFLAVLQLVINAGAIPIVTIFIVMMTHSRSSPLRNRLSVLWALLVSVPLAVIILWLLPTPLTGTGSAIVPLSVERLGVELLSARDAVRTLSTGEVLRVQGGTIVAFEVVALVLLVALVGAILLARRDDPILRKQTVERRETVDADA